MAKIFFSYSHKDEELRDALEVHLAMLQRQGLVESIHDRRITAGDELDAAIDAYLADADVILCLVSPDFIASNYCYSREMARALERHEAGEARVIAVILRHCDWQETPLGKLRATPRDGKPVRAWPDQDEALHDAAKDVRKAVGSLVVKAKLSPVLQTQRNKPEIASARPRSANLHIRRDITDLDRDEFLRNTFEHIAEVAATNTRDVARVTHGFERGLSSVTLQLLSHLR